MSSGRLLASFAPIHCALLSHKSARKHKLRRQLCAIRVQSGQHSVCSALALSQLASEIASQKDSKTKRNKKTKRKTKSGKLWWQLRGVPDDWPLRSRPTVWAAARCLNRHLRAPQTAFVFMRVFVGRWVRVEWQLCRQSIGDSPSKTVHRRLSLLDCPSETVSLGELRTSRTSQFWRFVHSCPVLFARDCLWRAAFACGSPAAPNLRQLVGRKGGAPFLLLFSSGINKHSSASSFWLVSPSRRLTLLLRLGAASSRQTIGSPRGWSRANTEATCWETSVHTRAQD